MKLYNAREQIKFQFLKVTGHSLGGSIASLAASFLVGSHVANSSEVKLITFGQPRTGDVHYSRIHNSQVSRKNVGVGEKIAAR